MTKVANTRSGWLAARAVRGRDVRARGGGRFPGDALERLELPARDLIDRERSLRDQGRVAQRDARDDRHADPDPRVAR